MMEAWFEDERTKLYCGDSLAVLRELPDESVQCCVTSPPYWALRDYGVEGQLGCESTPEEYVQKLVLIFSELRRVMRNDGVLFLNLGDSYAAGGKLGPSRAGTQSTLGGSSDYQDRARGSQLPAGLHETQRRAGAIGRAWQKAPPGLKQKDLVGIPWMVAFALRADGWYLRSEIIWGKRNPMPESVTDRPTKSHEQVFVLSKSKTYFWDSIGSQEQAIVGNNGSQMCSGKKAVTQHRQGKQHRIDSATRNMRSVWMLSSYPLKSAHFAAFPPELVRRCLATGVAEFGCCSSCKTPYTRIIEKRRIPTRPGTASKVNRASQHDNSPANLQNGMVVGNRDAQRHCTEKVTVGWTPSCECVQNAPMPCVVLDPFHGAGTTWKVCQRLGLRYVGIELNPEYLQLSVDRPAVHFPHERARKPRRVRKLVTPMLKGIDA